MSSIPYQFWHKTFVAIDRVFWSSSYEKLLVKLWNFLESSHKQKNSHYPMNFEFFTNFIRKLWSSSKAHEPKSKQTSGHVGKSLTRPWKFSHTAFLYFLLFFSPRQTEETQKGRKVWKTSFFHPPGRFSRSRKCFRVSVGEIFRVCCDCPSHFTHVGDGHHLSVVVADFCSIVSPLLTTKSVDQFSRVSFHRILNHRLNYF